MKRIRNDSKSFDLMMVKVGDSDRSNGSKGCDPFDKNELVIF